MKVVDANGNIKSEVTDQAFVWPSLVGCRILKNNTQSLSNNTWVIVTWNLEDFDTNVFHDTVTNNSRITIPSGLGGYYYFETHIWFDSTSTVNAREVAITKNSGGAAGTGIIEEVRKPAVNSGATIFYNAAFMNLVAGDYIEVHARQNSGTSLNVNTTSDFACYYLGPTL